MIFGVPVGLPPTVSFEIHSPLAGGDWLEGL
jgi:hypothetical protein